MILKAARILPYRLNNNFLGGKDRPGMACSQILSKIDFGHECTQKGTKIKNTNPAFFFRDN
jgi:hypothetical protein